MYKVISSSRDSDDLSIGFQRNIEARERELIDNKTTKGNYHDRIHLKDVFGFAERQDNCTYGLVFILPLQRIKDKRVFSQLVGAYVAANLALAAIVFIEDVSLYVPHYTPNKSNQKFLLGHIVSRAATELSHIKRSSYMKDMASEKFWFFEHGVRYVTDIPIQVKVCNHAKRSIQSTTSKN